MLNNKNAKMLKNKYGWLLCSVQGPSIPYWDRWGNWRFFVFAALLIKPKQLHGKNQNKNTGLFIIHSMDFIVVRTKINEK
jgi:hypothetical protein